MIEKVCEILINKNLKIAVAESLTGGMISAKLVDFPGISKVYMEGITAYSNESKINRLFVKKETLEKFGAVSKETATEMALGVLKNLNCDVSISTTGIAGPTKDNSNKPVGLVYIAVCVKGEVYVNEYNFSGNREQIRNKAVEKAFENLYVRINKKV